MTRIGYIGLGLMGSAMARNLMKAGHSLVVHNRSQAIVQELVADGATAAGSPQEVARQVDVVFTNLPDSPDVEQVVLGPAGIAAGAHEGLIYVDNSTIKPETARNLAAKLAEVGVQALDAPVSGGQLGAQQGTLVFMVGGPQQAFDVVQPLFKAMGKSWILVGDSGAGQIAKAANQIMVGAQMAAMAELLVFSQKCGVDPFKVVEAIKGGAAQCWTLDTKPPRLAQGNRTPGFKAYMQLKDLNIIVDTGATYDIPTPLSDLTREMFQDMVDMGKGEQDNSAVLCVLEQEAGVQVGPALTPNT
ncbi:MAG TPA: NAD(P)-binding domain-containing protein [Aggregatilineales bacterium]|nr:NAD(P)-binding domain-containing protein [Aggregatilineales bacterium]